MLSYETSPQGLTRWDSADNLHTQLSLLSPLKKRTWSQMCAFPVRHASHSESRPYCHITHAFHIPPTHQPHLRLAAWVHTLRQTITRTQHHETRTQVTLGSDSIANGPFRHSLPKLDNNAAHFMTRCNGRHKSALREWRFPFVHVTISPTQTTRQNAN
jgi:hypothetical protein